MGLTWCTSPATALGMRGSPTSSTTGRTSGRCASAAFRALIGLTACGAVDPDFELGSLVIFDDLQFASNRLPDGSLCTFFDEVGDPARGHWVLHGGPYSEQLIEVLTTAALDAGLRSRRAGYTGMWMGRASTPRWRSHSSSAVGVSAVSQTGGPETVLCGELELPFALVGFVTDYANEVVPGEPTPVATLVELVGRSSGVFARCCARRCRGSRPWNHRRRLPARW